MSQVVQNFKSHWLGLISYHEALVEQQRSFQIAFQTKSGMLLGLEHKPVITLGRRIEKIENALPNDNQSLNSLLSFFEVVHTDRGGEATMHTPGQLVVYPVFPIRDWGVGVREFVNILELIIIETLRHFNIESFRLEGRPGVFTKKGKIAFIGIRVRDGVIQHGLSINISNDLKLFQLIKPCGCETQEMDSLGFYSNNASPQSVFEIITAETAKAFHLTKSPPLSESATNHMRP